MNMVHPGAVLFDLDGTLIDSVPDITLAVNELMALDGLAPFEEAEIRRMVGRGLAVLVQRAYAARQFASPDMESRYAAMAAIYARHLTGRTVLMPGAREAVARLGEEGWRLAVVTNKLQSATEAILDHFGLRDSFALVIGDGAGLALKPAPDMLLFACEHLSVTPARAVMVGDSISDIEAARRAGIRSVAVRGGYLNEPIEDLGADLIADGLASLAID